MHLSYHFPNFSFQLRKIGWVLELDQVIDDDSDSCLTSLDNPLHTVSVHDSSDVNWQPVFLAVTDRLILIFSQAPQSPTEWSLPSVTAALVVTRAVVRVPGATEYKDNQMSQIDKNSQCFVVRTGEFISGLSEFNTFYLVISKEYNLKCCSLYLSRFSEINTLLIYCFKLKTQSMF